MNYGLISVQLVLAAIIGAVVTKRSILCLAAASLLGAALLYGSSFLFRWAEIAFDCLLANVEVWGMLFFFGSLIAVLEASGSVCGFSELVRPACKNRKRTLLVTYVLGIAAGADNYLSILSRGACMKQVFVKRRIPGEAFSYVLDATAASFCTLLPFSSWGSFFGAVLMDQECVKLLYSSAGSAYLKVMPYLFYPFACLLVALLFCFGLLPLSGPMKRAYLREEEREEREEEKQEIKAAPFREFLIPVLSLAVVTAVTGEILSGFLAALFAAALFSIGGKRLSPGEFLKNCLDGAWSMKKVFLMLLAGYVLRRIVSDMGITGYLADAVLRTGGGPVLPFSVFLVMSFVSFSLGSGWSIAPLLAGIFIPLADISGVSPMLVAGAVISGAAFCSHGCFYSADTVLAAQVAGVKTEEHAVSQFPYVLLSFVPAALLYLLFGFV